MSRSEPDWHIRSTRQSSSPTRDDKAGVGPFPLKVSLLQPIPENDDRCGLVPDRVEPESCRSNRRAKG